jgi:DNA polymerase III epsilon subunit-like protein
MNTTITKPQTVSTESVKEITGIADEMILSAVKAEKVAKVPAGTPNANRAWSLGGNVD